MSKRQRLTMVVGIAVSGVFAAACGGGTTGTAGVGAPSPVATAAAPSAGASSEPAATASVTVNAIPSFDLGALGGAIPGVDSYRVAVTTEGTKQYESTVVTTPELRKAITTFNDDGTPDSQYIIVGDQAWQADGNGGWEALPDLMAKAFLLTFDPARMFGTFATANWSAGAADQGVEDKNGMSARHFKLDSSLALGVGMPTGTTADMWVAEAGYLVALEIVGPDGSGLMVEVSNVNDPANVVEAPAS